MVNFNEVQDAKRKAKGLYDRAFCAFGLLSFILLFSLSAFAAEISVTADHNPVSLNDSLQLVFSSDASPDGDPDFTPLEKDFSVLNRAKSEQVSWVNGASSRTVQWTLTVMAKHAGELTVPPIAFGDDRSNTLRITVTEEQQAPQVPAADQDLFVQVEAAPLNPYVQAQVLYTLRLYRKVEIVQAGLTEPEAQDAVVVKLGEDSNYRTEVDGQPYVVTERKYAIFPQRSGALTIAPPVLTAQVVVGGRSRIDSFFSNPVTRTKRIVAKAITLDEQPIPKEFKGAHWLPAERLQLQEEWSGELDSAKTGEPLTRTLTLTVKGATAGQLPDIGESMQAIKSASGDELKNYPDQPVIKEQKNVDGLTAIRQQKIALIPSQAGEYRLPAIEVPWWNTRTNSMEIARVPERTIKAAAAVGQPAQPQPLAASVAQQPEQPAADSPVATPAAATAGSPLWIGAAAFSTLGWLLTALLWWRSRRYANLEPANSEPQHALPAGRSADGVRRLQKACRSHDANAAKDALIAWGRERFGETALGAIAKHCPAALQAEIETLNRCLYAPAAYPWNGEGLWRVFCGVEKQAPARDDAADALEPLYKR